jgi:hypothetical protein
MSRPGVSFGWFVNCKPPPTQNQPALAANNKGVVTEPWRYIGRQRPRRGQHSRSIRYSRAVCRPAMFSVNPPRLACISLHRGQIGVRSSVAQTASERQRRAPV